MDELDYAILAHLQQDGRKPFTEIAKALHVTEGTVRNRVARLVEENVVRIIGLVDPHRTGINAPAMVGIHVHPAHLDQALEEIAAIPEVSYLLLVTGEYDLLVEVMCRDRDHLARVLKDRISKVTGVQRTWTSMILQVYKVAEQSLSHYLRASERPPSKVDGRYA